MVPSCHFRYRSVPILLAFLAGLLAIVCAGSAAIASSTKDIDELLKLIKATGTEVVFKDCQDNEQGGYTYRENPRIDRLTVCKNNVDLKDLDAYWEVLAHEATHIMQACNGGHIIQEQFHPRIIRRLKAQAPHYAAILEEQYRDWEMMLEAEAFDMELQTPEHVKEWLFHFCLKPKPAAEEKRR